MKKDYAWAFYGVFCIGMFVGIACAGVALGKNEAVAFTMGGLIVCLLVFYPAVVRTIKCLRAKGE